MPKPCPQCRTALDQDGSCPECSYGRNPKKPSKDSAWWQCVDVDHFGNRCAQPGSLSESTRGSEHWFCHQHFPPFRSHGTLQTAINSARFPDLRSALSPKAKPLDFEAEIERLALQDDA